MAWPSWFGVLKAGSHLFFKLQNQWTKGINSARLTSHVFFGAFGHIYSKSLPFRDITILLWLCLVFERAEEGQTAIKGDNLQGKQPLRAKSVWEFQHPLWRQITLAITGFLYLRDIMATFAASLIAAFLLICQGFLDQSTGPVFYQWNVRFGLLVGVEFEGGVGGGGRF